MQKIDKGDLVDPFGIGVEIPHLPEEAGRQAANPQGNDGTPVAFGNIICQRAIPQPNVERFEDEVDRNPQKGKEIVWEKQQQNQHSPACDEEGKQRLSIGRDLPAIAQIGDPLEGARQLRSAEDRGHDGRKTERRQGEILKVAEELSAIIKPVLRPPVERFKKPPTRHRDQEKRRVGFGIARQHRIAFAQNNEGIHG